METTQTQVPFRHANPFNSFSVNDIDKAKDFYQNILGLTVTKEDMGVLQIHLDYGQIIVAYPKANHSPAEFTILNFPVSDIELAVKNLKQKGVRFEQYDYTDADGIARNMGGPLIAWFRDPAGNIISVVEDKEIILS